MNFLRDVGQRFAVLRDLEGKSLSQIFDETGVCCSTISGFERGKFLPSFEHMEALLFSLDTNHDEFFNSYFWTYKGVPVKSSQNQNCLYNSVFLTPELDLCLNSLSSKYSVPVNSLLISIVGDYFSSVEGGISL